MQLSAVCLSARNHRRKSCPVEKLPRVKLRSKQKSRGRPCSRSMNDPHSIDGNVRRTLRRAQSPRNAGSANLRRAVEPCRSRRGKQILGRLREERGGRGQHHFELHDSRPALSTQPDGSGRRGWQRIAGAAATRPITGLRRERDIVAGHRERLPHQRVQHGVLRVSQIIAAGCFRRPGSQQQPRHQHAQSSQNAVTASAQQHGRRTGERHQEPSRRESTSRSAD